MGIENINILGINITGGSRKAVEEKIWNYFFNGKNDYIVTANPEIVLKAVEDEEYRQILNSASMIIVDGFGLKIAGLFMKKNPPRFTGVDLCQKIIEKASINKKRICALSWVHGLSNKNEIETSIKRKYPTLEFKVFETEREVSSELDLFKSINDFKPEILLVGIGAPWQEKFIKRHINKLPSVKLAIGVGGSFDLLSGKIKRAPNFMRALGLEWLWRFFMQINSRDRRKRIYTAVFVFPYKFIKWRLINFNKKTA
jgi:N-acetylglucosaminyldiphosphoundecaprenol N-acetyl-beta-D-mannosaminyltransferase